MTGDGQPTTFLGAVVGKRSHHQMSAGSNGSRGGRGIGGLVVPVGQEMEGCAVVPHVEGDGEPHSTNVGLDELDIVGSITESGTKPIEGLLRDVDRDDRCVAGIE